MKGTVCGPRERMKSEYMKKKENPRPFRRAYSARIDQSGLLHESSSGMYQPHYLQFQQNDSMLSVASSFDHGIVTNLPRHFQPTDSRISSERLFDVDDCAQTNLHLSPFFQERHGLPPRQPRRYGSYQPSQCFNHSATHRRPVDPKDAVRSLMPSPEKFQARPMLERKMSRYKNRNHTRCKESDRSGRFPRVGDRPVQSRQQRRRSSSLSTITPEINDLSSSRSSRTNKICKMPPHGHRSFVKLEKRTINSELESSSSKHFHPQKSTCIYQKFEKKVAPEHDDDIWVERIVLNGPTGRNKTHFKSLRGNIVRNEPPTGASTIIYLEDIIVDRQVEPKKTKPPQPQPQPQPQYQAQQQQSQLEKSKILPLKLPKEDDLQESVATKTEREEMSRKVQPKRRPSFFGFMKKNRNKKPS